MIFNINKDYNYITAPIATRVLTVKELKMVHDSIINTLSKHDVRDYTGPIQEYNGYGGYNILFDPEYTKQYLLDHNINEVQLAIKKD